MVTDKALTKVLANFLYMEGMGEVSQITESTFWIEGKRKNKVEVVSAMLNNEVDFSEACLCCDFVLLALLDKSGDNIVLLNTTELKTKLNEGKARLVDIAEIISFRWAVEFLPDSMKP